MNDSDPETILKAINKETTKIKPIVFGKVKTRCKMMSQRKLEDLQKKSRFNQCRCERSYWQGNGRSSSKNSIRVFQK